MLLSRMLLDSLLRTAATRMSNVPATAMNGALLPAATTTTMTTTMMTAATMTAATTAASADTLLPTATTVVACLNATRHFLHWHHDDYK
jgi:hypothetical protein